MQQSAAHFKIQQDMKKFVISECLCRETSDLTAFEVAGSPTQAFGNDDII